MSLKDALSGAIPQAEARFGDKRCKLGQLMLQELDKADAEKLQEVLDSPPYTPGRLSNADIARVLRSEGVNVSNSIVDRHRGNTCRCHH